MSDESNKTNSTDAPIVPSRAPNCLKCMFFKVTWDAQFPRACEIFSIKTVQLPSYEVYRATGRNCPSFKLKDGLKNE